MEKRITKRYMFTLTQGQTEELQALCKEVGLPPATLSNAIDHLFGEMLTTFRKIKSKGNFTVKDMFEMMGEQMELLSKEGDHETKNELGSGRK